MIVRILDAEEGRLQCIPESDGEHAKRHGLKSGTVLVILRSKLVDRRGITENMRIIECPGHPKKLEIVKPVVRSKRIGNTASECLRQIDGKILGRSCRSAPRSTTRAGNYVREYDTGSKNCPEESVISQCSPIHRRRVECESVQIIPACASRNRLEFRHRQVFSGQAHREAERQREACPDCG